MKVRYALSQLSRPAARRAFGRAWLLTCIAGALATIAVVGPAHAFFVVALWFVCLFAPLRIGIEVLHTRGPKIRRELRDSLVGRADRYATPERAALMVETLFAREVHLPRLAPPDLRDKVVEAACGLSRAAFRQSAGMSAVFEAARTCAAVLRRWAGAIASGETGESRAAGNGAVPPGLWNPGASIQEQWSVLRAMAGMAALTITLAAVYEDSAGRPIEGGSRLRSLADAAMDYADQVGLQLEGPAWEEVDGVPAEALPADRLNRIAETWTTFCAAPLPAPRRLRAFLDLLSA